MIIYIDKEDVERIERGCDLGDWISVSAYVYPHRDRVPDLVKFWSEDLVQPLVTQGQKLFDICKSLSLEGLNMGMSKQEVHAANFNKNLRMSLDFLDVSVEDFCKDTGIARDLAESLINGEREPDFKTICTILSKYPIKMEKLLQ